MGGRVQSAAPESESTRLRVDGRIVLYAGMSILVVVALVLRLRITGVSNVDYEVYLSPWFDTLDTQGFGAFREGFANYNFPYLFFLYLSTLLPLEKIVAYKLIAIAFDLVLATAVLLLVRELTGSTTRAQLAGVATLFLPTVFINSAFWGQSDAIYVSFVLLSLYAVIRDRHLVAWVLFGVAFAFKLQAIFVLPVLVYVWMLRKGRWWYPAVAVPVFLVLSLPPVLAGRPVLDTLSVYLRQYGAQPQLTAKTPNAYFWLPAELFDPFNAAGILLALGVIGFLLLLAVLYLRFSPGNLVYLAALFLLVTPFILPQMHDRYFYGFEILCLVIAAADVSRLWLVFVTQLCTFAVYSLFLFSAMPIPFAVLAVVMFALVLYFVRALLQRASPAVGAAPSGVPVG